MLVHLLEITADTGRRFASDRATPGFGADRMPAAMSSEESFTEKLLREGGWLPGLPGAPMPRNQPPQPSPRSGQDSRREVPCVRQHSPKTGGTLAVFWQCWH